LFDPIFLLGNFCFSRPARGGTNNRTYIPTTAATAAATDAKTFNTTTFNSLRVGRDGSPSAAE
jgi:hypothetical protein